MDLSKRDNTLQTLRYLIDGGLDERYDNTVVGDSFRNIVQNPNLYKLLDDWYIKNSLQNYQSNIKKENPGM